MLARHLVIGMFSVSLLCAEVASSQGFPTKPIRILCGEAGGSVDFTARLVAQGLSGPLGQNVITENRPTIIAIETAAKAQPDGYTLLVSGSTLWLQPFMQNNVPWDPVKDFAPISWITKAPLILVVHPSVPAKSVSELIALAKAKPGALNYATSGAASSNRLAAELFKAMAAVNIVRINYKGAGPAVNSVIAGEVQMMIGAAGGTSTHVKSGRLRALAVTSAEPSALVPGLPVVAAMGLPGYEYTQTQGLFAPAKTPAAIIKRLNQEIVRALGLAEVKERFLNSGTETVGSSQEELAAKIRSEMTRMGKVIKDVGIRAE